MAVAKKAITANPIKNGGAVSFIPGVGIIASASRYETRPDSDLNTMATMWDAKFRNRLFYTTGAADPADPG